jgi:hypothetical protein
MAALNFPSNPTSGDIYANYRFDGVKWDPINTPISQLVNGSYNATFGTEVTMDNLKVRINGTGGSGGLLQAGAISGTFSAYTTAFSNVAGAATQGNTNSSGITFTTTYANISGTSQTMSSGGDTTTVHLIDTTNSRIYRITGIHCQSSTGGYIAIERMA